MNGREVQWERVLPGPSMWIQNKRHTFENDRAQTASVGNLVYWIPQQLHLKVWCDTQWDSRTLGKSMYLLLSSRINSITALGEKNPLVLSKFTIHTWGSAGKGQHELGKCLYNIIQWDLFENKMLLSKHSFPMSYQSQFCISYFSKRMLCNLGILGLSPEQFEKWKSRQIIAERLTI